MLFASVIWSTYAPASTFIGNGGNMLDPTLRRILNTMSAALTSAKDNPEDVCACRGTSEHCAALEVLSEEQQKYCAAFIEQHNEELASLIKPSSGISHVWVEDRLSDHKQHRQADAIAQLAKKRIILSETKFRDLNDAGRLQLLTHEYGHFLIHNGKAIEDQGSIGPFKGADGGRQLLDVVGAALVVQARRSYALDVDDSRFSGAFYRWRISYSNADQSRAQSFAKPAFQAQNATVTHFSLTYYPRPNSQLGYSVRTSGVEKDGHGSQKAGVDSSFHLWVNYLGLEWRGILMPWSQGSWASNIHYGLFMGAGGGSVSHKISDKYNTEIQSKDVRGGLAELSVYFPLKYGFLASLGIGVDYTPFKLETINVQNRQPNSQISYGVSYGF